MTIRTVAGLSLAHDLPEGGMAYIDRDWLPQDGEAPHVSILALAPDGRLRWPGGRWIPAPKDLSADQAAAAMFNALARTAVLALPGEGLVAVPGTGIVAVRIRQLIGDRLARAGGAPALAAVDTTGRADRIAEATEAVVDMGTVVLAMSGEAASIPIDLYSEVHKRGVRLVGVAFPEQGAATGTPLPRPATMGGEGEPNAGAWFVARPAASQPSASSPAADS